MFAERVRGLVKEDVIVVDDRELRYSVSVGVATVISDDEVDLEKLIARADRALYHAKEGGKDRVVVFAERDEV